MFQCSYGELNMVLRQTGSGLFNSRGMVRVCVYGFLFSYGCVQTKVVFFKTHFLKLTLVVNRLETSNSLWRGFEIVTFRQTCILYICSLSNCVFVSSNLFFLMGPFVQVVCQ